VISVRSDDPSIGGRRRQFKLLREGHALTIWELRFTIEIGSSFKDGEENDADRQAEPFQIPAPAVILDPHHSAWHGILLADAMRRAGVQVATRFAIDEDPGAGNAAILRFLRDRLLSGERGR
jgi:hypothetical protein